MIWLISNFSSRLWTVIITAFSGELINFTFMHLRIKRFLIYTSLLFLSVPLYNTDTCVLTLIQCLFHPSITAVAHKRPQSFCQKCRWQDTLKHTYILDPMKSEWADQAWVSWPGRYPGIVWEPITVSGNKVTGNSSGNIQPELSWFAEPLWTDPGLKIEVSVRKLISA